MLIGYFQELEKLQCVAHTCNPSSWGAEVVGSQSEASLGQKCKPYLKNKLKQKGLGIWLK
jgi:hypothetical protein